MVDGKLDVAKEIRLELSVPCDTRFRQVVAMMSEKMATYVGYAEGDATAVADTVVQATDGVFDEDGATPYTALDVTFATSDAEMEIRVRYICAEPTGVQTNGDVEARLRSRGDAPLEAMQRVMRRVEFGQHDGVEFCALTKLLPDSE